MPTWPTIGSISFLEIDRNPDPPSTQVKSVTHPGINGAVYQKLGKLGREFDVLTIVDCDNAGGALDVEATIAACKAIEGTVTTMNNLRQSITDVVVLAVEEVDVRPIASASVGVSTNRTWLLTLRWTMQHADFT